MSGPYGYSAADSVTGAIYQWTLASVDFSGTGYPGPNAPVNQRLVTTNALDVLSNTTPLLMVFTNATTRRAQSLTVADLGRRGLQLDTAKIWDVVPSLASPGTYTWGDNAGPEAANTPLTIMAGHIVAGYIPESGLSSTGWLDAGPNHYDLTGTCTVQTNQINGYSCAKGNGTTDKLARTQALSPPGTTPLWRYTVARIDTYANNLTISAFGTINELGVLMHSATDQVSQWNSPGATYGNVNAGGCTVGSFKLIKAHWGNSTGDSIKAGGGTLVTGTSAGNPTPASIQLLSSNSGFGAVSVAEDWIFTSDPGTSLDSYFTTKFPGCET